MDRRFIEFMGKFLLNAAEGQKRFDEMARWMGQGFRGFDDLTDLFCGIYGLRPPEEGGAREADAWKAAFRSFKDSFEEWLSLMDVVPRNAYEALEAKHRALRDRSDRQEETIRQLRALLNDRLPPHTEAVQGFADLMQEQAQQFQRLMENVGKAFEKEKT